uniref:VWFD domain-containing protein n=1 Tax=Knipowitschia caucasica TaxID=637954 RepID=A0AAV2KQQ7_KNICA
MSISISQLLVLEGAQSRLSVSTGKVQRRANALRRKRDLLGEEVGTLHLREPGETYRPLLSEGALSRSALHNFTSRDASSEYCGCLNGGWCQESGACDCAQFQAMGDRCQIISNQGQDRDGICRSWGQHHYETFDGIYFYFPGTCSYILAQDCHSSTPQYTVWVHNSRVCEGSVYLCPRALSLFFPNEEEIHISGYQVHQGGRRLSLPHTIGGVFIERLADYLLVKSVFGFSLAWDGESGVYLKMSEDHQGGPCGLCGNFNHLSRDDLTTARGIHTDEPAAFANSWTIDLPHERHCPSVDLDFSGPCQSESDMDSVTLVLDEDVSREITLTREGEVIFGVNPAPLLPYVDETVEIRKLTSVFTQLKTEIGLRILYDGQGGRIYLQIENYWRGLTLGLCGTFNGNLRDDFLSPSGMIEGTPQLHSNAWKVSSACVAPVNIPIIDPCEMNQHNVYYANQCEVLVGTVFAACHGHISPSVYQQQCRYQACRCGGSCLCTILAHYAYLCSKHGADINFRPHVSECGGVCLGGMLYHSCVSSCGRTCRALSGSETCDPEDCAEGCGCPQNSYYDDVRQRCVQLSQCHCYSMGGVSQPGEVTFSVSGPCLCRNGKMECVQEEQESDSTEVGECPEGKVYHSCNEQRGGVACAPTCRNLMLNMTCPPNTPCIPGCVCPPGYSPCPAVCTVYSDRHYHTFDGLEYDYHSDCQVYLIKGHLSGMCGNFDSVTVNDMSTSSHIEVNNAQTFGDSWALGQCESDYVLARPCEGDLGRQPYAKRECALLYSDVFAPCHNVVDVSWFYRNCLTDTCNCNRGGDLSAVYNDTMFGVNRSSSSTIFPLFRESTGLMPAPGLLFNFMITAGLQKEKTSRVPVVSIESAERPNYFIVVSSRSTVHLERWSRGPEFSRKATFIQHQGLFLPGHSSFELISQPGTFLTLTRTAAQAQRYDSSEGFKASSSFMLKESSFVIPYRMMCEWRYQACASPCVHTCSDPDATRCQFLPPLHYHRYYHNRSHHNSCRNLHRLHHHGNPHADAGGDNGKHCDVYCTYYSADHSCSNHHSIYHREHKPIIREHHDRDRPYRNKHCDDYRDTAHNPRAHH